MLGDQEKKGPPVTLELDLSDTVSLCHFFRVRGSPGSHVDQGAVGEDHVGRDVLGSCHLESFRSQSLEEYLIAFRQDDVSDG